jgi:hypothetical protein
VAIVPQSGNFHSCHPNRRRARRGISQASNFLRSIRAADTMISMTGGRERYLFRDLPFRGFLFPREAGAPAEGSSGSSPPSTRASSSRGILARKWPGRPLCFFQDSARRRGEGMSQEWLGIRNTALLLPIHRGAIDIIGPASSIVLGFQPDSFFRKAKVKERGSRGDGAVCRRRECQGLYSSESLPMARRDPRRRLVL